MDAQKAQAKRRTGAQLGLFSTNPKPWSSELQKVAKAYVAAPDGKLKNEELYEEFAREAGIPMQEFRERAPIGDSGKKHSIHARRVRWHQMTLKMMGIIEPVPQARGQWRITSDGKRQLTPQRPKQVMLGFSTDLGIAVWADAQDAFSRLDTEISAVITSPPYPIAKGRAYGTIEAHRYVDFICRLLEPVVAKLAVGGNIALNITNDCFMPGSPARSLYKEYLVIALCERLGLFKMDEVIWSCPNKAPAPIQWASLERMQLNTGYEPVVVFCNSPRQSLADNRRVLQPHSEKHLRLIRSGGERREQSHSDGAYKLRKGKSFANETEGRIPKNVLTISHTQAGALKTAKQAALAAGLPVHGAPMPLELADTLVQWLCPQDGLVADVCLGWGTTAMAAEMNGRPWVGSELHGEYLAGGAFWFEGCPGFQRFLQ